jgi:uncharacterized RmlC-like cupin family protein
MKKLIIVPLSILIVSFLGSCGKKDYTSIEGQVLEKGSNKPIANAQVIFSECVAGEGTGSNSICLDVETVLTNAQGKYIFTKEKDDATYYRIRAEKNNYGKPVEVFQTADAGQSTKNLNFTLPAFAWIKFHVKNVNPFDDDDRFAIFIFNSSSDGIFHGKKVDTSFIQSGFLGGFSNKFTYSVKKNTIYKQFTDSIFCKPLDTAFYEIKY